MGLSFLLLMPRTEDDTMEMEAESQQRLRAGKNVTTADYKAAGKNAVNAPTQVGRGVHAVYHVGTTTEDAVWIKKCALGRPM